MLRSDNKIELKLDLNPFFLAKTTPPHLNPPPPEHTLPPPEHPHMNPPPPEHVKLGGGGIVCSKWANARGVMLSNIKK